LLRSWWRLSRLVPLLTITGAAAFLLCASFGLVKLRLAEGVLIGLLSLVAVDALVERISILERLERSMGDGGRIQPLRKRDVIPSPDRFARQASSIHVLAVSGISIARRYEHFFRQKLSEGCRIEFLLLKPDSTLVEIWKKQNLGSATTEAHIHSTLQVLRAWVDEYAKSRCCEVRLLNMFAPFSLVGVDFDKRTATMLVEFHGYKTALDQRAHIEISKEDHPYWFNFFRDQYLHALADSEAVDWNQVGQGSGRQAHNPEPEPDGNRASHGPAR